MDISQPRIEIFQIDVERQKNVESKLAKLEADFAAIRENNKQIESAE